MHAEVMAIGDELTSGQRLDTNSQWLSQQLGDLGITVRYHTTVADDLDGLANAFRIASHRAPLVVVTGGLGPTADDLTRQSLAQATGRPLELDPASLKEIQSRFAHRSREMPPQNEIQAMFPHGSAVIPNPHGTAPGIDLTVPGEPEGNECRYIALPGVPVEMREMWDATVKPAIRRWRGETRIVSHYRLKCFGVGESQLEAMMPDLIRRGRDPQVGITVHRATITLRISTAGIDETECRQRMQSTIDTIHGCLGPLVFGEEDDELEHIVLRKLLERQQSLAVCELGTAGIVSRWLSHNDIDGRVAAGIVFPSRISLRHWFDLPEIVDNGSLVQQMAAQLRQKTDTDYALAIGPLPKEDDAQPLLHFGIASKTETHAFQRTYAGHPDIRLERAAKQTLDELRRILT